MSASDPSRDARGCADVLGDRAARSRCSADQLEVELRIAGLQIHFVYDRCKQIRRSPNTSR